MRAPLPQGDRAGADLTGGLRHGRGIGRDRTGIVRLPAAALRFRRVRAIKEAQRPHTATGNKNGSARTQSDGTQGTNNQHFRFHQNEVPRTV